MDAQGRLWGRLNVVDLALVVMAVGFCSGFLFVKTGHAGINKVIKGEGIAEVDLFVRGSIKDPELFKVGEKPFITLRNQPYAPVEIVKVSVSPKKVAIPSPDGKSVSAFPDPTEPFGKDVVLTIREKATITDDAIVFGGCKIKVGVPIDLEGFKYRLKGSIVDVRLVK
ncbi:MAG TPA: pyruvate/2-oxoglutarate dehydrogenase complex,dihydrolipoamide dehydrogenase (E3) component [Cyanobacteria bacterium UBA8530]|nr:pyruvate/2-oxoglutarate dehydrogenase complex,dihydrolipoamide dehydrogenase (E3) component [Cyanobacteria bacterium UBA8530]